MSDPASILIVRLSALGDVIHVLPALEGLRAAYPQAKIGWAVEDKASSLLQGHPHLDRIHVIPRQTLTKALKGGQFTTFRTAALTGVRELRREGYEVALDFQSNFRSAALTRLSGAKRRIGQPKPFSKEGSRLFYTDVPAPVSKETHKIERNLELLSPLGIRPQGTPRPSLPPRPEVKLAETSQPDGSPWRGLIAIHPGVSVFGALKAWRPERFAALGKALVEDGVRVVYLWGGASEEAQVKRLVEQAPGTEAAPKLNLIQLAALLEQSQTFVGVDSGPLHVAAALGVPVVGLYGPKHTGTYGPYWPGTSAVAADFECSPCRYRRCPRDDAARVETPDGVLRISPCMDTIEVARVRAECLLRIEAKA